MWANLVNSLFIGLGVGAFIMVMLLLFIFPHAMEDHTHSPTGLQDGATVCIVGAGVVDYNMDTFRPFTLCGEIAVSDTEGATPPLDSATHLAQ